MDGHTPWSTHDMDDRWLSVEEVAEYLGVQRDTIYTWLAQENLPGFKVGRVWRFKREDVDAWVRSPERRREPGHDGEEA